MIVPIGQDYIVDFFKSLITDNRLGHAYLFCGGAGIGKKTLCNYITKLAMCTSHTGCGTCNACLMVESGATPDVVCVSNGDKASIGVDKIRGLIGDVYIKPITSDKKIFIIQNAHLLTTGAQNALLKVIEEPPSYAVFFLLCDSINPILSTILSRVTKIDIPPMDANNLRRVVPDCEEFMYYYCSGNPGKLAELKSDLDFIQLRADAIDVMRAMTSDDGYDMYSAGGLFEGDRSKANTVFDIMLMFVRDVMLCKNGLDNMVVNKDKIKEVKAFSASVTTQGTNRLLDIISHAQAELGKSGSIAMAWQAMFVKCREVIHDRSCRNTL